MALYNSSYSDGGLSSSDTPISFNLKMLHHKGMLVQYLIFRQVTFFFFFFFFFNFIFFISIFQEEYARADSDQQETGMNNAQVLYIHIPSMQQQRERVLIAVYLPLLLHFMLQWERNEGFGVFPKVNESASLKVLQQQKNKILPFPQLKKKGKD